MNLLRYIRYRGTVSLSAVTGGSPALIRSWACPGQLWVAIAISQLPSHVLQASVCSNASASCLGILSVW